jgi:hypothetical protein
MLKALAVTPKLTAKRPAEIAETCFDVYAKSVQLFSHTSSRPASDQGLHNVKVGVRSTEPNSTAN